MKTKGRNRMKGILTAFAASVLVGALGSAAMAQTNPQVTRFDTGYLNEHPEVAQQLASNPGLVDNHQFMENHAGLREYFANHPEVRSEIKNHPYRFMSREDQANNWHGKYWPNNWTGSNHRYPAGGWGQSYNANNGWHEPYASPYASGPHPLRNSDAYLDQHPDVAQQLNQNPRLIDNPQYVQNHPGLHNYLEDHPVARHEWKTHPYKFMGAEHRYDQKH